MTREVGVVGVVGELFVVRCGDTLEDDCREKYLLADWNSRDTEAFRVLIWLFGVSGAGPETLGLDSSDILYFTLSSHFRCHFHIQYFYKVDRSRQKLLSV